MSGCNAKTGVLTALVGAALLAPLGSCIVPLFFETLFGWSDECNTVVPSTQSGLTTVHRDIPYTSPGGTHNTLDLHLPLNGPCNPVTILYIHGGAWIYSDKSDSAQVCDLLAIAGFPVVTCNYSLSTIEAPGFPQAVYDVKAVVRWIRTDGSEVYNLAKKIVVVGESAGGYLALMLGTTDGLARFEPQLPYSGDYRVDAVIAFFAPADLVYQVRHGFDALATEWFVGEMLNEQSMQRYIEASPITYVSEANPPVALLHGEWDMVVPFEGALRMRQAFANVCRYCRLVNVPGAGHGLDGFGGNAGAATVIADLIPKLLADRLEPDLNGDGAIDALDVGLFQLRLLDPMAFFASHPGCNRLQADLNGDGLVDERDLSIMTSGMTAD